MEKYQGFAQSHAANKLKIGWKRENAEYIGTQISPYRTPCQMPDIPNRIPHASALHGQLQVKHIGIFNITN
jgi:hypothetical protein